MPVSTPAASQIAQPRSSTWTPAAIRTVAGSPGLRVRWDALSPFGELMGTVECVPPLRRVENRPPGYQHDVPGYGHQFERIEATLKKAAAALRDAEVDYAL